jgi:hypothetical protein
MHIHPYPYVVFDLMLGIIAQISLSLLHSLYHPGKVVIFPSCAWRLI